jgi:preprotein translocase subunit SecG
LWIIFIADAILLVLIVLLQSGRGGGLSGMLGGGGGAEAALGPKTGLPRITGWMAAVFFVTAILIGRLSRQKAAMPEVKTGEPGEKAPVAAPKEKAEKAEKAEEGAGNEEAEPQGEEKKAADAKTSKSREDSP